MMKSIMWCAGLVLIPLVAIAAPAWQVDMTLQVNTNSYVLSFGGDPAGTNNFDKNLDLLAPPAPPSGYYAYFQCTDAYFPDLERDIRGWTVPTTDDIEWPLSIRNAGSKQTTLTWNPVLLPIVGIFHLVDGSTEIDMRSHNTYSVTGDKDLLVHHWSLRVLSLASTNPDLGVTIDYTPEDIDGNNSGVTPIQKTFVYNTDVSVSAPSVMGAYVFNEWLLDGKLYAITPTTTLAMDDDYQLLAVYGNPPCDCQFTYPILDCFEKYIQLAGPTMDATSVSGFCQFNLPNTAIYNLTKTLDAAPQLRLAASSADWSIETRANLVSATSSYYAAGLMVYFSKYDVYQWGYNAGYSYLKVVSTQSGVLTTKSYTGGKTVDLRIRKVGTTYYFDYKAPTATSWTTALKKVNATVPVKAGLLCLTTAKLALKMNFDYCCMTGNNLEITSPCPLPDGRECVDYSYQLQARGGTSPYQNWTVNGMLPPGLTLDPLTGIISGVPTEPNTYNFTLRAQDSGYHTSFITKDCSITIGLTPVLTIQNTSVPVMCPDHFYITTVTAQGGCPPYTWVISSGALPTGFYLDPATGVINGMPTAEGVFPFTIKVSDSHSPANVDEQALEIDSNCCNCQFSSPMLDCFEKYIPLTGPTVETTSLPGFCRFTLPNTAIYNLTKTLDAAPQLRMAAGSGDWTVETRVNVASNSSSSFTAGLMVCFSKFDVYQWGYSAGYTYLKLARTPNGVLYTKSYTGGKTVDLRIRKVGTTYFFDYKAPTSTVWTNALSKVSTTLPLKAGLLCTSTAKMALKADFDYCCLTGNQLEIMSACPLPGGQECVDYNNTLQARGGTPPYQNWSVIGSLPPGLNLASTTGIISGTPTEPGDYNFILKMDDSDYFKNTITKSCAMTIGLPPTLTILTTTLPVMCQTSEYSATVTAQGGCPPYVWAISSGTLPNGLSLDPATGVIRGTPEQDGTFQFTIKVSDSHDPANVDEQALEIVTNCCNCQFSSPLLDCFEKYIPTAGPTVDASTNPGFCRFVIPNSRIFNQSGVLDDAPQLRTNVGSGDWQIETRVTLVSSTNSSYALGLEVYFSQFDVFQWGYSAGYTYVKLYRSAKNILLTKAYAGGKTVDLKITKAGNIYSFYFKTASATIWTLAGTQTETKAPVKAGLLSRTTAANAVTVDYDYCCKTGDELKISTTTLPTGYINKTYSSQMTATGGKLPYTWSIVSGSLPDGLDMDETGLVSGIPTTIQTANFFVRVTDAEDTQIDKLLLIDVQTPPVIDQEFTTGSLAGYTSYIPVAGPTITSGVVDQLRITVPNTRAFDHWTSVDAASQLRRPLDLTDWTVETKVKIVSASNTAYHVGFLVYFSQYDLYYWGYNVGTGYIKLSLTGTNGVISKAYTGGTTVELRIEKVGNTYTFKYRKPGVLTWSLGGTQTRTAVPTQIGLIARTTSALNLTADFDYLRLAAPALGHGETDNTGSEQQAELEAIPTKLELSQNYPNPFNSRTHLDLALPEQSSLVCKIYNIQGQLVRDLYDTTLPAGTHRIEWDGLNDNGLIVNSGAYFVIVRIRDQVMVRKILFLK
jgi:hypothetical protein